MQLMCYYWILFSFTGQLLFLPFETVRTAISNTAGTQHTTFPLQTLGCFFTLFGFCFSFFCHFSVLISCGRPSWLEFLAEQALTFNTKEIDCSYSFITW